MPTPSAALPLIAPGAQVVVRDEEWLVRAVQQTPADGKLVRVIGASELVREQEATFFTELDDVQPLRPEDTTLVLDPTPGFRRSRLYLEALIRKTPLPAAETRLAVGHRQLLDQLEYQRHPVKAALEALRPRLLIADAVGLGKTLEVGMVLSELMRRGRGDRILVVTPRHILEQFQHELWTRFAIPLVRLDSEGIQRVRQKIPATRNPFTYYKRVIISIDTLKNAGRYRHHLEGIRWDAVVIDECHNLVNRGTLNNQLARVLAPRTDALILTSATPHNGKPESFAELVRLLDPTAIADPKRYERPTSSTCTSGATRTARTSLPRSARPGRTACLQSGCRWRPRPPRTRSSTSSPRCGCTPRPGGRRSVARGAGCSRTRCSKRSCPPTGRSPGRSTTAWAGCAR